MVPAHDSKCPFYIWCRESQHPTDIIICNKVPGRSQYVDPNNIAAVNCCLHRGIECTGTKPYCPLRHRIVLRLNCTEMIYQLFWRCRLATDQSLIVKAIFCYLISSHKVPGCGEE